MLKLLLLNDDLSTSQFLSSVFLCEIWNSGIESIKDPDYYVISEE